MNPALLIGLINAAIPGGIALTRDIIALFRRYPGVTPDQFIALVKLIVTQADGTYDSTISTILGDQAAHQTPPVLGPPGD